MITKKRSEISDQEYETYTGIIIYENGTKEWFLNGQLHRTDGPAIEYVNGDKSWYLYDKRHRTDGPAIEFVSGTKSWYYQGKYINANSQKDFESWLKNKGIDIPTKTINCNTTPINNHTCTSCGNTRCSKTEKSCWLCGSSLHS